MNPFDPRLAPLHRGISQARDLMNENKNEESLAALMEVLASAKKLGVDSPDLIWTLAIAHDNQGELEKAMTYIQTALAKDPLSIAYRRSFDIIARRIREALAGAASPEGADVPKLYELLVRTGEADVASHLAMARWHLANKDTAAAQKLVDAVTTLSPTSRDAWQLRAQLARDAGDEVLANRCAVEAAAVDGETMLFGCPGGAQG